MNMRRWVIFVAALGMMAATAGYLGKIRQIHRLGPAGVRVGAVPLFGEHGEKVTTQSVLLPEKVMEAAGTDGPITEAELTGLPKDTTFGRRYYSVAGDFRPTITVVLMGTDRTSIHDPHYCLRGGGWVIDKMEHVPLRIDRPYPYELPAIRLTTSTQVLDQQKHLVSVSGIYIYWFVTADKITADQGVRLWSIAKRMVEEGELERWAYISYFVACAPGQEESTFGRLQQFIRASVPEFQIAQGKPAGTLSSVASGP
ncbi:MAG: exosortase-associated EpsI family protein [Limisphaerales bacterium]